MTPAPIPLTLLTGFLGAGKTTVLNRLLRQPELAGTLVIVNEIGEISLDHYLITEATGDVIALPGGCLCCTVRSDLVETLERISGLLDRGEIPPLSRVIIETTGLAEPARLLQSVLSNPAIGRRFALDRVITVVDGVHAVTTLAEHAEARSQIAVADRLILTKTDHPEAQAQAGELAGLLKRLAPHAPQLDEAAGEAEPAVLLGATRWFPSLQVDDLTPAHQGDIRTTTLWRDRPLPPSALGLFADFMRSSQGAKILRLKGLVQLTDDPERPLVIHGVRHMFDRPRRLDAWPDEDRRTRIVVIGKDLDASLIGQLYDAFSGGSQVVLPS